MFIFDDLIKQINNLNSSYSFKSLDILNSEFKENPNQFIFSDDKAYELGASPFYGVALSLLTDYKIDDEILLLGSDLDEIKEDGNYARIIIANIDDSLIGEGNILYNNIRKFDYLKFRFSLDGIMVRESSYNKKESLLLSKKALKENKLNFSILGSYIIDKYKKLPFVKSVKVIFVTLKDYPYKDVLNAYDKCENIIKALDHIMNNIKMDCHSCSLKVICNEVEKKVQEDFKK